MADVNPAEVSAILKKQLSGFSSASTLDEVGTVLEVGDGIARVFGLSNAQYGELVSFDKGLEGMVLNLEEDHVGVVLLGPSKGVKEGDIVKRTQRIASIKVGDTIVKVDSFYFRPTEVETLLGDPSKAKKLLGWEPEINLDELIDEMILNDLDEAKQNVLLKNHGFGVNLEKEK